MSQTRPPAKKPYAAPKLRVYGDLRTLTQGGRRRRNYETATFGSGAKRTRAGGD